MLKLGSSLFAPRIIVDSSNCDCPSLYHLTWGGGDPPELEHVRFMGFPSIATGAAGNISGGDGFKRTVRPMLFV